MFGKISAGLSMGRIRRDPGRPLVNIIITLIPKSKSSYGNNLQ